MVSFGKIVHLMRSILFHMYLCCKSAIRAIVFKMKMNIIVYFHFGIND